MPPNAIRLPVPLYLYSLPRPLSKCIIKARPSAYNKSPYLVDVEFPDGRVAVAHNPALGCNGLVAPGVTAYVMPAAPASKAISEYTLYHVVLDSSSKNLVCIHPAVANSVAEAIAEKFIHCTNIRREVAIGGSRFDMVADRAGRRCILEVKNASIADTVCCMPSERSAALKAAGPAPPLSAIFPYGNKQKRGLVSPRALKHANELAALAADDTAAYILYLTQRTDVSQLLISTLDTEYRAAVAAAKAAGVQLRAYSILWEGEHAYLHAILPVIVE
jgi:DNA-binding sugar fermentation-stimulating protein